MDNKNIEWIIYKAKKIYIKLQMLIVSKWTHFRKYKTIFVSFGSTFR